MTDLLGVENIWLGVQKTKRLKKSQAYKDDRRGGSGSATNPLKPKEGLNGPRIFLGWGAGSFGCSRDGFGTRS
jgi:hypothetical protein